MASIQFQRQHCSSGIHFFASPPRHNSQARHCWTRHTIDNNSAVVSPTGGFDATQSPLSVSPQHPSPGEPTSIMERHSRQIKFNFSSPVCASSEPATGQQASVPHKTIPPLQCVQSMTSRLSASPGTPLSQDDTFIPPPPRRPRKRRRKHRLYTPMKSLRCRPVLRVTTSHDSTNRAQPVVPGVQQLRGSTTNGRGVKRSRLHASLDMHQAQPVSPQARQWSPHVPPHAMVRIGTSAPQSQGCATTQGDARVTSASGSLLDTLAATLCRAAYDGTAAAAAASAAATDATLDDGDDCDDSSCDCSSCVDDDNGSVDEVDPPFNGGHGLHSTQRSDEDMSSSSLSDGDLSPATGVSVTAVADRCAQHWQSALVKASNAVIRTHATFSQATTRNSHTTAHVVGLSTTRCATRRTVPSTCEEEKASTTASGHARGKIVNVVLECRQKGSTMVV